MSLDFLYHRFGEAEFPSDQADVTDGQLFSALDPARDRLLALFKAAINQELGGSTTSVLTTSAWDEARAGTPVADALPVADTLYQQPTAKLLQEADARFPLLCVYRTGRGLYDEHTLTLDRLTQTWGVDYVLPPLRPSAYRRLGAVLSAVPKIVALCIRLRGHRAFESGALQFGDGLGTLSTLRMVSAEEGAAQFADADNAPPFYAVHCELESIELVHPLDGVDPEFDAANLYVGVGSRDGVVPDLIEASTDVVPDPTHGSGTPGA